MEKTVIKERAGSAAVIKLNRPEKRNAINQDMLINLYRCIEDAAGDDSVKALILTGSGTAFSSGIDLEIAAKENLLDPCGNGKDMPDVFAACKKPLIGAINGHAINAGFEIALNCDFLIASESAVFLDTHAKMGLQPGWGLSQLLPQAVGNRMAKQISFTCRPLSAKEAMRIGLVNEVIPDHALIDRVVEIVNQISAVNSVMVEKIKELIDYRNQVSHSEAYKNERRQFSEFYTKLMKR